MPRALVVRENKKLSVDELEIPEYGPKDLLIKVTHAAQNPTDWKHVQYGFAKPGSVVGCDFSGEVVEVGNEATGNYKKGDRVAGCVHGGLDQEQGVRGAYSEYVVQDASLVFRYPSSITPEAASTLPLASVTAALALFHEMKLPLPSTSDSSMTTNTPLLVWGGSTSVGQYAIQLGKAAGCYVITTASPARHAYLKELGADACFDYNDKDVVSQIKQAAKDNLSYAIDCISETGSTGQVCSALTGKNAQVATVLPGVSKEIPSHIKQRPVMMYTIFGKKMHVFGEDYEPKPEDKAFAEKFYKLLGDQLLAKGQVKPNKVTKIQGGLNGIEEGFKKMMDNKVTAEKLVYTLDETTTAGKK